MQTDMLTGAVLDAVKAVAAVVPSQSPAVSVSGVRKAASGVRPVRGIVTVCTVSNGFADPLGDLSASSADKAITVLLPKRGDGAWFDATDPAVGDVLTLGDGDRYAVVSVEEVRGIYYKLGARQC